MKKKKPEIPSLLVKPLDISEFCDERTKRPDEVTILFKDDHLKIKQQNKKPLFKDFHLSD